MILAITGAAGRRPGAQVKTRELDEAGITKPQDHELLQEWPLPRKAVTRMVLRNEADAGQLEDRAIPVCAAL
jgi:hypothetical protein